MAIKEDIRTRSPRGTKTVTQAFFEALDAIPDGQQKAVATAALASIRGDLKARRLKAKDTAARAKARAPAKAKTAAKGKTAASKGTKAAPATKRAPLKARKVVAAKKAPVRSAPTPKAPEAKPTAAKAVRRKPTRPVETPTPESTPE
jgi:hypothetical protein